MAVVFPRREVRLQVDEAMGLLVARWRWSEVIEAMVDRHGVSVRTAERRLASAYDKLQGETAIDRSRQLSMARDAAALEIRRIRADIEATDSPRIRGRLSRIMLGWEVHLARLNGILLGRADQFAESGDITLVLGLPIPGEGAGGPLDGA